MENKTLEFYWKPGKCTLNVPVVTKWNENKRIWNIGSHNPYISDGYVILCDNPKEGETVCGTIDPSTLEFLYVEYSHVAQTLMDAASWTTVSPQTLNYLKNYDDTILVDTIHEAAEYLKGFI